MKSFIFERNSEATHILARWAVGVAVAFFLTYTLHAAAQAHPVFRRPEPRSTVATELNNSAVNREIRERFSHGLSALASRNDANAVSEFGRILALRPAEPQGSTARYDLALDYAQLGLLNDATMQLRAAINLDHGFLAAMANLIAIDLQRHDLTGARAVADRFVTMAPDSARALYMRGIVALRAGDPQTASNDFGKLAAHNPRYALSHYDLGIAELQLSDMPRAEQEFDTALELSPRYARAQFALGTVLIRGGHRVQAQAAFDRASHDAVNDVPLQNLASCMRDAIRP